MYLYIKNNKTIFLNIICSLPLSAILALFIFTICFFTYSVSIIRAEERNGLLYGASNSDTLKHNNQSYYYELLRKLKSATNHDEAAKIAGIIKSIWKKHNSATVIAIMRQVEKAIDNGQKDYAFKLLEAVIDLAPEYTEVWYRRAMLYYIEEEYENAIDDLRQALEIEPNHFSALMGIAIIREAQGNYSRALMSLRQALEIYPMFNEAILELGKINRIIKGRGI